MSPSLHNSKKKWEDMINQSVHTAEDGDIGDIDALSRDFIVIKRGYLNEHYYYVPIARAEGWDGNVLWLNVTEDKVKTNYERKIAPDPSRYYIKDYPMFSAQFPELRLIPPKYKRHDRIAAIIRLGDPKIYGCALCEKTFKTEQELSHHVASAH
ncbi:MAG: hypothetical protein ACJ70Y_01330 [Nitrososphaera sp.]